MYVRPRSGTLRSSSGIEIIIKVGVAVSGPSPRFTRWLAVPFVRQVQAYRAWLIHPEVPLSEGGVVALPVPLSSGAVVLWETWWQDWQPAEAYSGALGIWPSTPGEFRQPGWMRVLGREDRSRVSDALARTLSRVRHIHVTRGL